MEQLLEESAKRIAEIDKLKDKYGYFIYAEARANMPLHIEKKLEQLHAKQSDFELEYT
jgi:hypothetical protein